jgi:hypothetical protein
LDRREIVKIGEEKFLRGMILALSLQLNKPIFIKKVP